MIAATAFDLCNQEADRLSRALSNARKIGNERMVAHFERKLSRAERAICEWESHPALQALIEPRGRSFVVRTQRGSFLAPTLADAQIEAIDRGFRVFDLTRCGRFA